MSFSFVQEQPVWNSILEKSKSLEKKISKSDTDVLADIVCLSLSLQLAFLLFSKNSLAVEAIQVRIKSSFCQKEGMVKSLDNFAAG